MPKLAINSKLNSYRLHYMSESSKTFQESTERFMNQTAKVVPPRNKSPIEVKTPQVVMKMPSRQMTEYTIRSNMQSQKSAILRKV